MYERLQKVMAHAGVASRRESEQLILDGKVKVNGQKVTELGVKVDPTRDQIKVNNQVIKGKEKRVYYIVNKPRGYLTTVTDDRGRKTILDLVKGIDERIYPVGRLDYNSEGLLILTNDGRLANQLMHPRYRIRKWYLVEVSSEFQDQDLHTMRAGIKLDDGMTQEAYVEILQSSPEKSLIKIGIAEGRNRQVRRMCEALGYYVKRLIRTQIGPLKLGKLSTGSYRSLTPAEISKLKQAVKRDGN